mgnify:CR=1 FL=1
MSILSALRTYLKTYSGLKSDAPVWVQYLGNVPTEYSIVPLPGNNIIESYINGGSLREYPFAFQSMESTADDLARLENQGFYEAFADWLETQTESEIFPTLDTGKKPVLIETTNWGYLFEEGESDRGIYQITCRLQYEQARYEVPKPEEPEEPEEPE